MAQLLSNEIKKGRVIFLNDEPTLILSHEFSKTGRAGAVNRTKVKGLKSGVIKQVTFAGSDKVEEVEVANRNMQFLYQDGDRASFMDPETFEQYDVPIEMIPDETAFLKEGNTYQGVFFENEVISVVMPKKIALAVTEAPDAMKGDTANNPQKLVTVETGYTVHVPMFIKVGDVISINTEEGAYVGKA